MKYELSQHAWTVIHEREIKPEWISQVLDAPLKKEKDSFDDDLEHCLGQIDEYGKRVLRVIINRTRRPVRVVTAYFDRKMKGKL